MKLRISKWIIFEDSLFVLFYPFLAFDVFLFYDDSANALAAAAKIWALILGVAFVFYAYLRRSMGASLVPLQVAELAFFSFEVLFFAGNLFLASTYLFLLYTGNTFLI